MRKAFAQQGFRRLFAGLSTSMFGDSVMLLVLSMWVKDLTGSNARAGLVFLWMVLPSLAAPLLGMWVDRVRRRPMLVWGNAISALVVLPLLLVNGADDVWIVNVVAFGYGVSFVVLPSALNGLLKELLPDELLVEANSSLQTVKEGYRLIGPLIGAGLFASLGGGAVAVVDAVSFLVASAVIASIPLQEKAPERDEQHWWHEMTAGLRFLAGEQVLRHVLLAFGLTMLVIGFAESSIYALLDSFGRPVEFAGVIVSVQGLGAVAGGLTASRWVRRVGEAGVCALAFVVLAASLTVVALAPAVWLMLVGVAVLGYSLPLLLVAFSTLLQRRTPQSLMGRASTAVEVVMGTPQALSLAGGALLVTVLEVHLIYGIMAAVIAASAGYLALSLRGRLLHPDGEPAPMSSAAAGMPPVALAVPEFTFPGTDPPDVPPR